MQKKIQKIRIFSYNVPKDVEKTINTFCILFAEKFFFFGLGDYMIIEYLLLIMSSIFDIRFDIRFDILV